MEDYRPETTLRSKYKPYYNMLAASRIGRGIFQQQKVLIGSTRNLCAAVAALNPIVEVG